MGCIGYVVMIKSFFNGLVYPDFIASVRRASLQINSRFSAFF